MHDSTTFDPATGIAVIGMAGRFPQAKNVAAFWQNLRNGVEGISFFSDAELKAAGVDPALLDNPNYVKAGGILEGFDLFDAAYFDYTPREAEVLDPQQRLFLECAVEALEQAAYDPEKFEGAIGVYGGLSISDYLRDNLSPNRELLQAIGFYPVMLGNDKDYLCTRVSYKLNLIGPSLVVQTACSTSLVAICLAYQSLLNYQCDLALAGGVGIGHFKKAGYLYQVGGILSPDGHCRAFDADSHGCVAGDGVGIVVLKRLEDALHDGDHIHAVIKGAALNNDGSVKVGYTAPSVDGQAQVIAMAQALAGVTADTITMIEAHGTGTELGDPIEMAALTKAFRATTDKRNFCAIGSAKTNVGHLDAAAGVTGVIKAVLALAHREIPPSLNFKKPNPQIDFANSPFYVNTALAEWETDQTPRRAGVSAFGVGGTNAHVVLEEAPPLQPSGASRPAQLLVLSAKTGAALEAATQNLHDGLEQCPEVNLADAAYTLQIGRREFKHRRAFVCRNREEAIGALQSLDRKKVFTAVQPPVNRAVAFMFPGQGAQYVEMTKGLYQTEATFREHVDRCAELLQASLQLDLREVIYPRQGAAAAAAEKLKQTSFTQPALFVIEYALAQLWKSWGVQPQAMIGHSIGEYVAACLADVFSLEEALTLVAARGKLMQQLPGGAMLAISLPEAEAALHLNGHIAIAAINAPALCVVSGPTTDIDELAARLEQKSVECRRLHTSHAFHSAMMEDILAPFTELVSKTKRAAPKIPFISNVTGKWITTTEATDPRYWARHLRQTVRFSDGVKELLNEPARVLLEVGPGQTLTSLARMCRLDQKDKREETAPAIISSTRHPQEPQSDDVVLLNALGQLWLAGVKVDWAGFYSRERRRRVPLPTYPFERKRYWVEPQQATAIAVRSAPLAKNADIADWFYAPGWARTVPANYLKPLAAIGAKSCWLIFADDHGLGEKIIKCLERAQQNVVAVTIGEKFSRRDERAFTLDPRSRDDYETLLKTLRAQELTPQRLVHLWGVTPADSGRQISDAGVKESSERGFYSLLYFAQALGNQEVAAPLHISVVTSNAQNVTGEDLVFPEKAAVLGACRVLPQEYPNVSCRNLDISFADLAAAESEELINQLVMEFSAQAVDSLVAYRHQARWTRTWQSVYLPHPGSIPQRLRHGGVYWITGGLGGIGLALAEYLAQTVPQVKLVLSGRSELPPKEKWEQWLSTHNAQDGVSVKIRGAQKLETLGAEVMIARADVADAAQMQSLLQQVNERFGPIHGVIHAAGIAGGGMMQHKAPEIVAGVMNSKITGALALASLLKEQPPDFVVLCSSVTAILGGFGQADYCAANAFLDAFAQRGDHRKPFTVAINWDTWAEVGMAVNTELPADLAAARVEALQNAILPREGMQAFGRILNGDLAQVVVSTRDWRQRLELETTAVAARDEEEKQKPVAATTQYSRPELTADYAAPENEVEKSLAEIWTELFGVAPIGRHDNFFELGGHSLLATRLISRARDAFQTALTLKSFFEKPTIAEMAEAILEKMVGEKDADMVNRLLAELEAEPAATASS